MKNIIEWIGGLVTTSFNYQKLKVETAMEEINDIVNSDMANIEDNDSLENSMKTDSEEQRIFKSSEKKTDIEEKNIFINSDEKTDNEKTKNQRQQSRERKGCHKNLKTHLTEEQEEKSSKEDLTLRNPQLKKNQKT